MTFCRRPWRRRLIREVPARDNAFLWPSRSLWQSLVETGRCRRRSWWSHLELAPARGRADRLRPLRVPGLCHPHGDLNVGWRARRRRAVLPKRPPRRSTHPGVYSKGSTAGRKKGARLRPDTRCDLLVKKADRVVHLVLERSIDVGMGLGGTAETHVLLRRRSGPKASQV